MSNMRRYALRYAPLLLLALLFIPLRIFLLEKGQHNALPARQQISAPFSAGTALYAVTTSPNGEAWAVGGSFSVNATTGPFPLPTSGLLLHYVDHTWIAAAVAQPLRYPLLGVSLDSPHDGWAVGWAGTLVHYDGNTWSTVANPSHFNQNLLGVAMVSSSNGWAVGYSGAILHYDGRQWTQVQSPTQLDLHSIAMLSAQEGWAVGNNGTLLHYQHGTWGLYTPSPTNNVLRSVDMISTQEGWAVGDSGTILHYRDGLWERVYTVEQYQAPRNYQFVDLFGIAMDSLHSGWIISDQHLLSYRSEAWQEADSSIRLALGSKNPTAPATALSLYGIATSPTGTDWAVGRINNNKTLNNTYIILQRQGNTWYTSLAAN